MNKISTLGKAANNYLTTTNNSEGITLITLVVTIVILMILVSVSINTLFGENGIIKRTKQAKEQTLIGQYKEKIELIKMEANLKYNNGNITLEKIKNELDDEKQKYWVNHTEIITDNKIEKIKLTTNDGYIFYITEDLTEYKGTGEITKKIPTAEEISYTPKDTNWQVDNVKKALDYLFNN